MSFGDFRDLEKGRRTQCLFLLLSTLPSQQLGRAWPGPDLFYGAQGEPATNPLHQGTCSVLALACKAFLEEGVLCQVQHKM